MANICIIDDDILFTDDMSYLIADAGHKCKTFRDADNVLNQLHGLDKFNMIILDIMMMRGEKLVESYSTDDTGEILHKMIRQKYPTKKIIVISAKSHKNINIDFENDRHTGFIQKPMTEDKINELLNIISKGD